MWLLQKAAVNSTAASNVGRLRRDNVTLTFDLWPKAQPVFGFGCPKMHRWLKFGENPSIDTEDIAETYSRPIGRTDGGYILRNGKFVGGGGLKQ